MCHIHYVVSHFQNLHFYIYRIRFSLSFDFFQFVAFWRAESQWLNTYSIAFLTEKAGMNFCRLFGVLQHEKLMSKTCVCACASWRHNPGRNRAGDATAILLMWRIPAKTILHAISWLSTWWNPNLCIFLHIIFSSPAEKVNW